VFDSPDDIVKYFVDFWLDYYGRRKAYLLSEPGNDLKVLSARAKFVKAIVDRVIEVANVKKADIERGIESLGIERGEDGYEFLFSMPIHTLTAEKYAELLKRLESKQKDYDKVLKTEPADFYKQDLKDLKRQLEKSA